MITLRKMTGWNSSTRAWPALVGSLIVAGMTCLSSGHSALNANDFRTTADRPATAPVRAAGEQSVSVQARHPLDDALEFVEPSLQALKHVKDYTAILTKIELLHGRLLTQQMDMKFRQKPFSVYLNDISKRTAGREAIFVAGRNDGKLVAHEVGLKSIVGTMLLKPDDPKVMDMSRHPITEIGIAKILELVIETWKHEKQTIDSANMDVRIAHNIEVGASKCDAVEISHHRRQPGLTYQMSRICVDCQSRLPVQAELYGWPANSGDEPPLLEKYTYANINTNVGLSDTDFDPRNQAYRFDARRPY